MTVNQSGQDGRAAQVDDSRPGWRREIRANLFDPLAFDQDGLPGKRPSRTNID